MSRLGRALAWSLVVAIAAALTAAVLVPRVAGATPYTVMTGSMEPDMPPGTLVVTKPTPVEQIGTGEVVTYQLASGRPQVVTHRVVAVGVNAAGEHVLRTQGDANTTPDAEWVRPVQVKGTAWYSVPHLGRVSHLIDDDQRMWAIYAVAAFLVGYAVVLWAGTARDRLQDQKQDEG